MICFFNHFNSNLGLFTNFRGCEGYWIVNNQWLFAGSVWSAWSLL